MKLHNLQPATDLEVEAWLRESIPELTPYQKSKMMDDEIIRFAPFQFFKVNSKVSNPWLRLTVIFIPLVWLILFIGLFFNFIITGRWGYSGAKWFYKWTHAVGL